MEQLGISSQVHESERTNTEEIHCRRTELALGFAGARRCDKRRCFVIAVGICSKLFRLCYSDRFPLSNQATFTTS